MNALKVQECIQTYRSKYGDKLKRLWLCPQIVRKPKVGGNYTLEIAVNSKLSQLLSNAEVTKHWVESDCLCIAYKISDEDLAEGVDKLLERNSELSIEEVIE